MLYKLCYVGYDISGDLLFVLCFALKGVQAEARHRVEQLHDPGRRHRQHHVERLSTAPGAPGALDRLGPHLGDGAAHHLRRRLRLVALQASWD